MPAAVLQHARRSASEFGHCTATTVDADQLITGRAALLGLTPRGRVSAGGASRLLPAADGWCALTLSRPDDVAAVPALLAVDAVPADPWPVIADWAAGMPVAEVSGRARLLGLPAAGLGETAPAAPRRRRRGVPTTPRRPAGLLVADLSSMWAGPLCAHLLARAQARVVKVESPVRPDGPRAGPAPFFDWMNGEKLSYSLDFAASGELKALLTAADVVIESSRPAALERRGLGPADVAPRPGQVWLRVTGHGAVGERAHWVAFGDDAAVSGGLVGYRDDGPVFCADAIADPLTGLAAARAVAESLARGGGELIELSMAAVAAGYAALPPGPQAAPAVSAPPPAAAPARALGADNDTVRRLVAERLAAAC